MGRGQFCGLNTGVLHFRLLVVSPYTEFRAGPARELCFASINLAGCPEGDATLSHTRGWPVVRIRSVQGGARDCVDLLPWLSVC